MVSTQLNNLNKHWKNRQKTSPQLLPLPLALSPLHSPFVISFILNILKSNTSMISYPIYSPPLPLEGGEVQNKRKRLLKETVIRGGGCWGSAPLDQ